MGAHLLKDIANYKVWMGSRRVLGFRVIFLVILVIFLDAPL